MYNILATTTHKIFTATFYKYKPKAVKLQGHIPFGKAAAKSVTTLKMSLVKQKNIYVECFMILAISLIEQCVIIWDISQNCLVYYVPVRMVVRPKFKTKLLDINSNKLSDKRKCFMVKIWITKAERKERRVQSFLDWKFERCSYVDLINLLTNHVKSMAEHSFMASWNYWQYKLARRNIIQGDIIMVLGFAQNYLCTHQNKVQRLHWHHQQVTVMPTIAHYLCPECHGNVTHEIVHVSDDLKHDSHFVKVFTNRSEQILEDSVIMIHKIIEFTHQAPSQYKNKTAFHYLKGQKFTVVKNCLVSIMGRVHVMLVLGGSSKG